MRPIKRTVLGVLCVVLAACSPQSNADAAGAKPAPSAGVPTLRLVRSVSYRERAEETSALPVTIAACKVHTGITSGSDSIPSLKGLHFTDEEELFDGERHAKYTTITYLYADPAHGCGLVEVKLYNVDIETSCGESLSGSSNDAMRQVVDRLTFSEPEAAYDEPSVIVEPPPSLGRCSKRAKVEGVGRAPQEVLPGGARCVWTSALVEQLLSPSAPLKPGPSAEGTDSCVHATWPEYPFTGAKGNELSVVMRTHQVQDDPLSRYAGVVGQGIVTELDSYEEGIVIPASRFTRAAAEAFIHQPVVVPLGKGRAP